MKVSRIDCTEEEWRELKKLAVGQGINLPDLLGKMVRVAIGTSDSVILER